MKQKPKIPKPKPVCDCPLTTEFMFDHGLNSDGDRLMICKTHKCLRIKKEKE